MKKERGRERERERERERTRNVYSFLIMGIQLMGDSDEFAFQHATFY